jgi:hypothetical protein
MDERISYVEKEKKDVHICVNVLYVLLVLSNSAIHRSGPFVFIYRGVMLLFLYDTTHEK